MFVEKRTRERTKKMKGKTIFPIFFLNEFMENTRTKASLRIPRFSKKSLLAVVRWLVMWCGVGT